MVSNETENLLEQNCRPDWPEWTCLFGNICGLTSTTLWFLVLLPQVWKNFRRKSVRGLSILWATANFTASLTNLFFVHLYAKVPLYNRINSVYMPILEFTILVQFWIYGDHYDRTNRQVYLAACLLLWVSIIIMQLVLKWYDHLQWFAISLWCIETFPQVILNIKLRSTKGQSTVSVLIAMIGKTSDFFSNYVLVVPIQFVVMIYFSSSVAFVNGIQVAWYNHANNPEVSSGSKIPTNRDSPDRQLLVSLDSLNEKLDHCCRRYTCLRMSVICILSLLLIVCVAGLVWNTKSMLGFLGPLAIILVLILAYTYFNCRHSCRNCSNVVDKMDIN